MAAVDDAVAADLLAAAHHYGMDALIEVHDAQELDRALKLDGELVGINNRNLRTFETKLETTEELAPKIPRDRIVVGESGLFTPHDLARLARVNVNTFLIGESLMRQQNVEAATRELLTRSPTRASA
jgi:indole-3-glycerol phosphate synthase